MPSGLEGEQAVVLRLGIVPDLTLTLVMMFLMMVLMSLIAKIERESIQQRLFSPVGLISLLF